MKENVLGKRLRNLRENKGLSQKEAASKFGISNFALSRYENGTANPDPDLIAKFSEFYEVPTDYLLGLTDDPTPLDLNQKPFPTFGLRIKNLREKKGLSQRELAEQLGITRSALSQYELGNRQPDYETLQKIADFFDCSIDYLLGRVDDPDTYATRESFLKDVREKGLDYSGLTPEEIEMFQKWIDDYRKTKAAKEKKK